MNKGLLLIGIFFLVLTVLCIIAIISNGIESYYITGAFLFTLFGFSFIVKSTKKY